MLSISNPMKSAEGAAAYYLDERKENYYINGIDKQGHWFGGAAQHLGLSGVVDREAFRNLLDGFSPDGTSTLVQNAGKSGRQACWDMTFNAPKAVSVLWAISSHEVRRQIEAIHGESVETALEKAEQVGGITRRGPGGRIHERAKLLWATFQEGTSRAQDPHLHTHAVLLNFAQREDGTTGSLHSTNLFRWKMALGAVYQADLAARLQNQLGLAIEPGKSAFEIRGVPHSLCRDLSKRRTAIEKAMGERGVSGAVEAKTAAKDTRPGKEEIPPSLLFARWRTSGEAFGWGPDQAQALIRPGRKQTVSVAQLEGWVRQAVESVPADKQHRSPVVREAARIALQHGADGSTLFGCLTRTEFADGGRVLWQPREQREPQRQNDANQQDDGRQTASPSAPRSAQTGIEDTVPVDSPTRPVTDSSRIPVMAEDQPHAAAKEDRKDTANPGQRARDPIQTPGRQERGADGVHEDAATQGARPSQPRNHSRASTQDSDSKTAGPSASAPGESGGRDGQRDSQRESTETDSTAGDRQRGKNQASGHAKRQSAGGDARFTWTTDAIAELDPRQVRSPSQRRDLVRKWVDAAYSGKIDHPMPSAMARTSLHQVWTNRRFLHFFARRLAGIPKDDRWLKGLTRFAVRFACQRGVDPQTVQAAMRMIPCEQVRRRTVLPDRKPIIRIERQEVIRHHDPDEPCPIKLPVICIGDRDPTWWRIKWRMKVLHNVELRVQERVLFPKVARWNPIRGVMLPALRVVTLVPRFKPSRRDAESTRETNTNDRDRQNSSKSDSQSHTNSH